MKSESSSPTPADRHGEATSHKTAHFMPDDYADRETAKEELKFMGFIEESAERISCAMEYECWFDEN